MKIWGTQPPPYVIVPKISLAQNNIGMWHHLWHRRLLSVCSLSYERIKPASELLRSAIEQDRLNNFLLLNCRKSITDTLNTVDIAKKYFLCEQATQKALNFREKVCAGLNNELPPVSKRSSALVSNAPPRLHPPPPGEKREGIQV